MDFKFNQVPPVSRPLIEKRPIGCFHELVARRQVLIDPTRDVRKPVRRHPAAFLEPAIYGCGFTVAEVLDYHKQRHVGPPTTLLITAMTMRPNVQGNRRAAPTLAK
jgi:hypothetical protein